MHMHYVKSWIVSAWVYVITCIEVMAMLFRYYGARFAAEAPASSALDFLYYIIAYLWFFISTVFAIRSHEITKRSNFFNAWKQEQETEAWKKLLRNIPEPILFTHNGDLLYFNQAVLSLFEITEETYEITKEHVWNSLETLTMKSHPQTKLKDILKNPECELPEDTLFIYKQSDHKKLQFVIRSVNISGVIEYLFHDVTAWKHLEKNKVKNQCFDILLATASHDIKTPLNVMMGVIDVLADYVSSDRGKEQVNVALTCGQRMLYYLKGLDFIRQINTNALQVSRIKFNPSEVAISVTKTMEFSAQSKSISLKIGVEDPMPKEISSDKEMYSIIMQNLMENAIKYTFHGGVDVSLSFDRSTNIMTTIIADTGIGMDKELINDLFKVDKQTNRKGTDNEPSTGLGLILCYEFIEKHGGNIKVESEVGKGSTFSFTLPANKLS